MKWLHVTYFILLTTLYPSYSGFAQQDPIVSNYHLNSSLFNPAYSGIYNRAIINTNFRRQWSGLIGAPKSNNFSAITSIIPNMVGGGLVINQDNIGITTTTQLNFQGSYQIRISTREKFSFGLQGGFMTIRHNQDELNLRYQDDPDFVPTQQSASAPLFGAGVTYSSDFIFVGLSVPRLINTEFKDGLTNNTVFQRHVYATGSFIKDITPLIKLKPVALIKYTSGSPLSFDLNANILYNNKLWAGVFTRDFNTQGLLVQLMVQNVYRIGYSFEVPTNSYIKAGYITHEIVLSVDLALLKNQDVFIRYF